MSANTDAFDAEVLVPGSLNRNRSFRSVTHEPQGDGALVRAWSEHLAQAGK